MKNNRVKTSRIEHWHVITAILIVYDIIFVNLSYFIALWLRFDCRFSYIPLDYLTPWEQFVPVYTVVCIGVFLLLKLYRSVWRFASYSEMVRCILATLITAVFHIIAIGFFIRRFPAAQYRRMPVSYYIIGTILQFIFTVGIRFSYRFLLFLRTRLGSTTGAERVMLIGAGSAGQMILRDLHKTAEVHDRVVCIIDDNPNKWHRYLEGVPIVGGRDDIIASVAKYDVKKIYIALPSATPEQRRDILDICKETGCELKNLPGMYQFVLGQITATALRDVEIDDLLGREPIKVDMEDVFISLTGKVILVSGGGGSIGSELCRQIAAHQPKKLIIFEIYENNAHEIGLELREKYPDLDLEVIIGSVRDSRKVNHLFAKYKPDVVYHAAAHKHVPLMEFSPCEAIKNNTIGTYKMAYAAMHNNTKRFVLISTDKAVNPVNIMGASKRLCEMVIQAFAYKIAEGKADEMPALFTHTDEDDHTVRPAPADKPTTEFVAVRFGNVLGSNGSVIPLFKQQIAKGGPVTVTHPDIIRYFMTIPEAVSLVLQAGTFAHGGEIFVLDMGTPVKIDTLARNLIKLSGLKPDVDIKIEYTGLRPGEKLFEEKLMAEEGMKTTPNKLIHIGKPIPFDTDLFLTELKELMEAAYADSDDIRELVAKVVPTYHYAGQDGENRMKQ